MIPVYLPELDPANQEQTYTKVTCDRSWCIMEPGDAAQLIADSDSPGDYATEEIRMTPSQFNKLPDFSGW